MLYLQLLLLAERFTFWGFKCKFPSTLHFCFNAIFWGRWSGFSGRRNEDLSNGTNVDLLTRKLFFCHHIYGSKWLLPNYLFAGHRRFGPHNGTRLLLHKRKTATRRIPCSAFAVHQPRHCGQSIIRYPKSTTHAGHMNYGHEGDRQTSSVLMEDLGVYISTAHVLR